MFSNDKYCCVTGCEVLDVQLSSPAGIRHVGAFVRLKSEEDVKLALSRSNQLMRQTSVMGSCLSSV